MLKKSRVLLACVLGSALLLAAPAGASPRAATAPQALAKVKIVEFEFKPATTTVSRGSSVGWKNFGTASHTSTSDSGLWDSGVLTPGGVFRVKFRQAGTFTYHCSIHSFMTGTVVVTAA